MKTIINADDLGRNSVVNNAIIECIERNEISSTTIMANGEAFNEITQIVATYPQISYGVHLVLDELESLTNSSTLQLAGIIDNNGRFVKNAIYKAKITKDIKEAIYCEWCAQIDKILSVGVYISHIDSHHHVHMIPSLFEVLCKVAKKYGIGKVRIPHYYPPLIKWRIQKSSNRNVVDVISPVTTGQQKKHSRMTKLCGLFCNNIAGAFYFLRFKHTFTTSDCFCSVSEYNVNKKSITEAYGETVIELMCHPGHPSYIEETKLLRTLDFQSLVNYNQI